MSLRIDKYVWFVRLAKTRTLATELVQRNKIKLNDMPVKPSKEVKIGDTVSIIKNNATFSYKIAGSEQNWWQITSLTSPIPWNWKNSKLIRRHKAFTGNMEPAAHRVKTATTWILFSNGWRKMKTKISGEL